MAGDLGVLAALALLIVLALRGVHVFIASVLSAALAAAANGLPLADAFSGGFAHALAGFVEQFFLLFLSGAVFGRVMGDGRAAASIALALARRLGASRLLWVAMLASALLTYGGVNVFVVAFTLYPLGLALMRESNLPKPLFLGAFMLGAGTFTMTALPGTPSIHNGIAAAKLGTPLTAGWGLGLAASAVMASVGMAYLERARRRALARGEGFVPAPTDVLPEGAAAEADAPPWPLAALPMALVLVLILGPQWLRLLLPEDAGSDGRLAAAIRFANARALPWTCLALAAGSVAGLALFRPWLPGLWTTLSRGAEGAALPLLNTAAVIGFGGVVRGTPIFAKFSQLLLESGLDPIVSLVVAVNVFAGIVGSASGGLGIFMDAMAQRYLDLGVPRETLHRLATIASGGLDSLPHCGAVITTFTIMGLKHREGYPITFVVTVLVPLLALAVATALASI
jgi:H+/gluconate symporter-like permease